MTLFTNLKIETKLKLGFAIIFVLMLIMGVFSWHQTNDMHEQTTYLYNHPFQVRRIIGEVKSNVNLMHRDMKDLFIALDEAELQQTLMNLEQYKEQTQRLIDLLYLKYLGPKDDIDSIEISFVHWNSMREETIRLLRLGQIKEAAQRTKSTGIAGSEVVVLMNHIRVIDQYATAKADNFFI
ncbi:MAG: methyl-accepting chemotaxis sensory transducer [Bacteroidetes bacterium]|nr:MAG: methyl-accepting chemotaxis sensory transducer [Bacteroidota bacterium]